MPEELQADSIRERPSSPCKFYADVMLGSLARWLRVLGFDTAYDNATEDDDLIRICRDQGRTALTCDRRLARRKHLTHCILVESPFLNDQLKEVLGHFPRAIDPDLVLTRCLECNQLLTPVRPEEVREKVPGYVFQTQERFQRCPSCNRIFWPGTHREQIFSRLEQLLGRKIPISVCDAENPAGKSRPGD